ncbi:MAG: hypothetical protein JKY54_06475 [Flavobacteriales bacterium]|nr:hypothetical protein [Flavobacteriales bacterium]
MVRPINRVILIIVVISGIYSFYVHNDIDGNVPFVKETVITITSLLAVLLLIKINYKWQSLFYIKKRKKEILYCYEVGSDLKRRTILYEGLDMLTYSVVGGMHLIYPDPGLYIGLVLGIATFEGMLYFLVNRKNFMIGVTNKAVILATNRPDIIRINKLKAVINKSGNYDFQYQDGRVHKIERLWVDSSTRPLFNEVIKSLTEEKQIFCDDFSHGVKK